MEKGLLYFMNGNLQMGMVATRHMIKICQDEKMRRSLLKDLHAYEKFENAIINKADGTQVIKPVTDMAEKGAQMGIDMKTFMDDSPEKMADMLAKGYEKAIRDMHANLQTMTDRPQDTKDLATGYLNFMKEAHARYKGWG